ncbi:MAG: TerB N-terminal domain-containing protein, partial [Candidatus Methanomethylophilaceae archaeon]
MADDRNKRFLRDMERFIERKGKECGYTDCIWADYSKMKREEQEYYFHWRDCLRHGIPLEADRGHIELVMNELEVMDRPREEVVTSLRTLLRIPWKWAPSIYLYPVVKLVSMGESIDDFQDISPTATDIILCDSIGNLPEPLPPKVIDVVTGRPTGSGMYDDDFRKVYSRVLAHIIDSIGKDRFLSIFAEGRQYIDAEPWYGIIREGLIPERYLALGYVPLRYNGTTESFFQELESECRAYMENHRHESHFRFLDIIRSVVKGKDDEPEGGYMSVDIVDTSEEDVPVCFAMLNLINVRDIYGMKSLLDRKQGVGRPCQYVPSIVNGKLGGRNDQADYYRYWIGCLERGMCIPTDTGYVWSFLEDMYNHGEYDDVIEMFGRIASNYPNCTEVVDRILGEYMADWEERPMVMDGETGDLCSCMVLDRVVRGEGGTATASGLVRFVDMDWNEALEIDDRTADLFCRCLRNIWIRCLDRNMDPDDQIGLGEIWFRGHTISGGSSWIDDGPPMNIFNWGSEGPERFMEEVLGCIMDLTRLGYVASHPELKLYPGDSEDLENDVRAFLRMGRFPQDGTMDDRTFRARLKELSNENGTPSSYIPSMVRRPDYDSLSPEQLQYYLHWRAGIRNGDAPKGDRGYAWLLLCETACADVSWEYVDNILRNLRRNMPELTNATDMFSMDWCLSHNRDLRSIPKNTFTFANIRDILAHPVGKPDIHSLERMLNQFCIHETDEESVEHFSADLSRMDDAIYRMTGLSIPELFFSEPDVFTHSVYEDYSHCDRTAYKIIRDTRCEDLGEFIRWVWSGNIEGDCPIPQIPKGFREHLDRIPEPWTGPRKGTAQKFRADDPNVMIPIMHRILKQVNPYSLQRHRIPSWDIHPTPCCYVENDIDHPSADSMSEDAVRYYVYWRSNILKERFGETDTGYMNMLLADLADILNEDGVLETLISLQKAYGKQDRDGTIRWMAVQFARVYDIERIDEFGYDRSDDPWIVLDRISRGKKEKLSAKGVHELILGYMDLEMIGPAQVRAVNEVLWKCSEKTGSKVTPFRKAMGLESRDISSFNPRLMGVYGVSWIVNRKLAFHVRGSPLAGEITGLIKYSLKMEGKIAKGPSKPTVGPLDSGEVKSIVDQALGSVKKDAASPELQPIELDREAVESAQGDLDEVTKLMRIEEEEPVIEEKVIETPGKTVDGDPWEAFSSSLSDVERDHVTRMLSGPHTEDIRLEDSINAKAMCLTGDTVIEDGTIIEDYRQELERCILGKEISPSLTDFDINGFLL